MIAAATRLRALRAAVLSAGWVCAAAAAHAAEPRAAAEVPLAVIGMQLEPPVLDPTVNPAAAITEALDSNLYEGLVRFAPDGSARPCLAESWEISADGLTYVFHLRGGVGFHNGVAFDAATAKFSLDRALAQNSLNPQRSRIAAIRSVRIVDGRTIELSLSRRSGGLLQSLAWASFAMVEPSSAAANSTHPIGTGPFRFFAWQRGDSLTLERNPGYWGGSPALGRVAFKFIADPNAAYAALMAGDLDAFSNYPAPESFAQFAADRRFKVLVGSTESETVLALNNRHPPLNDVRVRRAIAHAIDRDALIDGAMFGYGTPIGSHFPPHSPDYVDLTHLYPHDVARARALLTEAGYPHGFTVVMKLPPPSYARRSGEILAAQLAQIGITAHIENLEWAQWLDQVFTRHDYDMSVVAHAEPMDYDIYARDDYYFGYSSPDFKRLMAELDDTVDPARRSDLLARIQRKIADDSVNGFLFQYPRLAIWNAHLQGVGFDGLLGVIDLGHARFDGRAHESPRRRAAVPGQISPIFGVLASTAIGILLILAARRFGTFFLAGRLAALLATLAAATAVVFVVVQVVPGDPVRYMMGLQADARTMALTRHQLGLDAPALERYFDWVAGLLRGDFGLSYTYRVPVGSLIAERLQVSLPLAAYALFLACAAAFPLGFAAAARRGRAGAAALTAFTQLGLAVPNFWLGMLLVMVFAIGLHVVSAGGFPGWNAGFWPAMRALTLPAVALALPQAAILARVLQGALLDTLHEDYIRTARAKGASDAQVLWRHALPNALIPVLTILGMQFSFLLAGGVIIENAFFLPGLGRLVFQAIEQRDLIVVQSVVMVLVLAVVCVTFVVELAYRIVNPRLEDGQTP